MAHTTPPRRACRLSAYRPVAPRVALLLAAILLSRFPAASVAVTPEGVACQDFEHWPITSAFGVYTDALGWTLDLGEVRELRGGYGPPRNARCAWLGDAATYPGANLRAPVMPHGVGAVSFWVCRNTAVAGDNLLAVQATTNAQDWFTVAVFTNGSTAWTPLAAAVDTEGPTWIRILKTGDTAAGLMLGLDDVCIAPPEGVRLTHLRSEPPVPEVGQSVHLLVDVDPRPVVSNLVVTAWFRFAADGHFRSLPMQPDLGAGYRTESPIPAASGSDGHVEYFIACGYAGPGPQPLFLPAAGAEAPATYLPVNPYAHTPLRQLGPSSRATPLIFSEIMPHPRAEAGGPSLEFIELFNTDPVSHDLGGYRLEGDVAYRFPAGTRIAPRSFLLLAAEPEALRAATAFNTVLGPYTGALPRGEGTLRLTDRQGAILLDLTYRATPPWPPQADGMGASLVLARPDYGEGDPRAWASSRFLGGSPGRAEPEEWHPLDAVVINEFLAHTDLPLLDMIELYNRGTQHVDLSGCWLTDAPSKSPPPFRVPDGTVLPPRGFLVFDQTELGFALSAAGEDIFLLSPDRTRVLDAVRFEAQANGVSSGRYPDGAPDLQALSHPTFGASNAPPRQADVVINEIMYHPISGLEADTYVELHNRDAAPVDIGHWQFTDGIRFTFPPGAQIPANGYVVVARDAARLIARYPQLHAGNTFGNFSGRLSNRGERLALSRPDDPAAPHRDFVRVNTVTYDDGHTWGHWTDGGGSSLELVDARSDNRRAMNWAGSDETGKAPWTTLEHTAPLAAGTGAATDLLIYLEAAGECLIGDVEVWVAGEGLNRVVNPAFAQNADGWAALGTHARSAWVAGAGETGGNALRLRAMERGRPYDPNHLAATLTAAPVGGQTATIRARVRWLAGWPYLVLPLRGSWLEAAGALALAEHPGTPGLPNSRAAANTGPAIWDLRHTPVLPAAGEAVRVTCRIHDPDGLAHVVLRYRVDPSTTFTDLPMQPDREANDGRYAAVLPGFAAGALVAFRIEATDAASPAAISRYPVDAPRANLPAEALVRFGDPPFGGIFGDYRIWMTASNTAAWAGADYMSNERLDMTFVYGGFRPIHHAAARYRGNGSNRALYLGPTGAVMCAYSVNLPKGERVLGDDELALDLTGHKNRDKSRQRERFAYWFAQQLDLPYCHARPVQVHVNGARREPLTDMQTPNPAFARGRYPDDPNPRLLKNTRYGVFDLFTIPPTSAKQTARYRRMWRLHRPAIPDNDISPIFALVDAMNTTDPAPYDRRLEAVADLRTMAGYFMLNRMLGNHDSWGYLWHGNLTVYTPPDAPAQFIAVDLDMALESSPNDGLFQVAAPEPVAQRLLDHPRLRRLCWSLIAEAVAGPLREEVFASVWDDLYAAFQEHGLQAASPDAPTASGLGSRAWLNARRTSLTTALNGIAAPFAITTGNGADFATSNRTVNLQGTAPVRVARFEINGLPADPLFPGVTQWSVRLGLRHGPNVLHVAGYDRFDAPVAEAAITITCTTPDPDPEGRIVFNEIMYHPAAPYAEFVELHNRSATDTFDLSGWSVGGLNLTFPAGSLIAPGGFLVAAESRRAYFAAYTNVEAVSAHYPGKLDNAGERLRLYRPDGADRVEMNAVTYSPSPPWPPEANGGGYSLQLIAPDLPGDHPGNWAVATPPTAWPWEEVHVTGSTAGIHPSQVPLIALQLHLHTAGELDMDDLALVVGVNPRVGTNLLRDGGFEGAFADDWEALGTHAASGAEPDAAHTGAAGLRLRASGPGQPATDAVRQGALGLQSQQTYTLSYRYRPQVGAPDLTVNLHPTDILSVRSAAPPPWTVDRATPGMSNSTVRALAPFPPLYLNEVLASNVLGIVDNFGEREPWIELYNAGDVPVALDGLYLANDPDTRLQWAFPPDLTLDAGAFLLVWADGQAHQNAPGHPHANFRLDPAGGLVMLSRHEGDAVVLVDHLAYGPLAPDTSWGRHPDGDRQTSALMHTPSPGGANIATSRPLRVFINEWMAHNRTTLTDPADGRFEDWFELFNADTAPADLSGYQLRDHLPSVSAFTIPPGTVVPPRGFLFVWADGDIHQNAPGGPLHVNFSLNRDGDGIDLVAPDGTLVNRVVFGYQATDHSEGRWPDGAPDILPMHYPTPGAANTVLRAALMEAPQPETLRLTWAARPGEVFRVEYCEKLIQPHWQPAALVTAGQDTAWFDTLLPSGSTQLFYRIISAP